MNWKLGCCWFSITTNSPACILVHEPLCKCVGHISGGGIAGSMACVCMYLFIYFGCIGSSLLCMGFSLVVASRGLLLRCAGFSLWWLLLLQSAGSRPQAQ